MSGGSHPGVLVVGDPSVAAHELVEERLVEAGADVAFVRSWDDEVDRWRAAEAVIADGAEIPATAFVAPLALRVMCRVAGSAGARPGETAAAHAAGVSVIGGGSARATEPTADFATMMILASVRRLPDAVTSARDGSWVEQGRFHMGNELGASHIGLVGMGHVAQAVARRLRPFGAAVSYWSRSRRPADLEAELGLTYRALPDLLATADVVSLHLRCDDRTWIAGSEFFAAMGPGSSFVTTAKGHLLDEDALCDALDRGHLAMAAVDVFVHEPADPTSRLVSHERVLATPHIAGNTLSMVEGYWGRACTLLLEAVASGPGPSPGSGGEALVSPSGSSWSDDEQQRAVSYGADADRYDLLRPDYPDALVEDLLVRRPSASVLDVGCGTGKLSRLFVAHGCPVTGVEPDDRMATVARAHGVEVDVARFETWEREGPRFDLVVSGQAWHWVDPEVGAERAADALAPGGELALVWTRVAHEPEALSTMVDRHRRLAPELVEESVPLGTTSPGKTDDDIARLVDSGRFATPSVHTYLWELQCGLDDWLAELPTHSRYAALPLEQREELLDDLRAALRDRWSTLHIRYRTVAIRARVVAPGPA